MFPQINIQSNMGKIGIRYQSAQLQIHSKPAKLSIHAPTAHLSIQQTPGHLTIDQTQAFSDEGLKTPLAFTRDQAAKAEKAASQGTSERVQWGARFADLAHGSASLAQYASRHVGRVPQLVPTLIPSPFSVHISYKMGSLAIHAQVQPVAISATVTPVQESAQIGQATSYVTKAPSLSIASPPLSQLIDMKI